MVNMYSKVGQLIARDVNIYTVYAYTMMWLQYTCARDSRENTSPPTLDVVEPLADRTPSTG